MKANSHAGKSPGEPHRVMGNTTGLLEARPYPSAPTMSLHDPQRADWIDPLFTEPYIDIDESRDMPAPHRYLHGGFKGTDARFSIYFAPEKKYKGRFFQHLTPWTGTENNAQRFTAGGGPVSFASASGGYFVESNMGRLDGSPSDQPTVTGYRTSAAVAKYARILAVKLYGEHRPYGYLYGGSGGGYKVISCMENTVGIWDGAVPFVVPSPMALPSVYTVRMHALRILRNVLPAIVDAIEPGGGGDMYVGLNEEERAALCEVTRFGFSPRTWALHEALRVDARRMDATKFILGADPGYFEDFWKVPGYLGAEPLGSLVRDRIQYTTKVTRVLEPDEASKISPPLSPMTAVQWTEPSVQIGLQLQNMPDGYIGGATITLKTGSAAGRVVHADGAVGNTILIVTSSPAQVLDFFKAGDEIHIDNSAALASQTYHRHQVPSIDYPAWNQYRAADGCPLYPQRGRLLGPVVAERGAGSVQNGRFAGKMIVVCTLLDEAALPWSGHWYSAKVKEVLGSRFDECFRLWYVDNALHQADVIGKYNSRLINYFGVVQQALRDMAAWVEKGTPPPSGTSYKLVDGQILVPQTAAARKGVQPVVSLTANGGERAEIRAGQPVTFSGIVEVPPEAGTIVSAEWDFEGAGDYAVKGDFKPTDASATHATVGISHVFSRPGTYFPALRVASQRQPDGTRFTWVRNLARVRVVVT